MYDCITLFCLRRENPELATNYSTQTMLIRQSRPPDEYEMRCTCPVPPQGQQQKVTQTLHRPQRTPAGRFYF